MVKVLSRKSEDRTVRILLGALLAASCLLSSPRPAFAEEFNPPIATAVVCEPNSLCMSDAAHIATVDTSTSMARADDRIYSSPTPPNVGIVYAHPGDVPQPPNGYAAADAYIPITVSSPFATQVQMRINASADTAVGGNSLASWQVDIGVPCGFGGPAVDPYATIDLSSCGLPNLRFHAYGESRSYSDDLGSHKQLLRLMNRQDNPCDFLGSCKSYPEATVAVSSLKGNFTFNMSGTTLVHLHAAATSGGVALIDPAFTATDPSVSIIVGAPSASGPRQPFIPQAAIDQMAASGIDTSPLLQAGLVIGSTSSDTTPPTTLATQTPSSNAAGWNHADVTVAVHASDETGGSGVHDLHYTLTNGATSDAHVVTGDTASPLVTLEGTNTLDYFATDNAGNAGAPHRLVVQIDKTAPVTIATAAPGANANAWWHSPVSVTLAVSDGLSGVADTQYLLDGGAWTTYATPVAITTEGVHTLQYRSSDRAGNLETTRALTVRIDLTPPEALLRFDPTTGDIAVFGVDRLSGIDSTSAGPLAPSSVTLTSWGDGDRRGNAELRTYRIADIAGNTLVLLDKVKRAGHEVKATVVSTQYNRGAVGAAAANLVGVEWALASDGSVKQLEQQFAVGGAPAKTETDAKFSSASGVTTILTGGVRLERPGMVLLQLNTEGGSLAIEY